MVGAFLMNDARSLLFFTYTSERRFGISAIVMLLELPRPSSSLSFVPSNSSLVCSSTGRVVSGGTVVR